jgi:glutamate synthase domain-containing protein 2
MKYECSVCGHVFDPGVEGVEWIDLPGDWQCPICGAEKSYFEPQGAEAAEDDRSAPSTAQAGGGERSALETYLAEWHRSSDDQESHLATIQDAAVCGESKIEPMAPRRVAADSWDEILFLGSQLARLPLNEDREVNTRTVIGPKAEHPLVIETPIYISHMSFGALSREVKIALATGSAATKTAMCSGEGGILPESLEAAFRYIFEYVPNQYSVTEDNLKRVDAIEIKIGQSAKPGMGGHLPRHKVTEEIASVRGFPAGTDIISPARFVDIGSAEELRTKVRWLRAASGGKPIGIKLAAGHIEPDLDVALAAEPDFITVDGRSGGTGAALKTVKDATSIPTVFALHRARRFLDAKGADHVSLVITGGLRVSSDFAKALALGADAIAIATSALIACGCQQYRICHTGRCPVGITSQDPNLRSRLSIEHSAKRLENFLRVSTRELQDFARLTGNRDVHEMGVQDLSTTSSEIARYTAIAHIGQPETLA